MCPRREIERDQQRQIPARQWRQAARLQGQAHRDLKECVLMAGEIVGSDGKGRDGLLGYLTMIARRDPRNLLRPARSADADRRAQHHAAARHLQDDRRGAGGA